MKLLIPFSEIECIVYRKLDTNIKLQKSEAVNTVNISYTIKKSLPLLGEVSRSLDIDLTINGIQDTNVDIQYNCNKYIDLVMKSIRAFLGKKIENTDMLKWGNEKNQVILCIDKIADKCNIEGVGKLKDKIEIHSINVLENELEIGFAMKL